MFLRRSVVAGVRAARKVSAKRVSAPRGRSLVATTPLKRSIVSGASSYPNPPFKKFMAANRGEIAIRLLRAGTELGMQTVGVFSHEDRYSPHRYKADESFQVGATLSPVGAYLSIDEMIKVAKENGVEVIHPGYGFLSENPDFARKCKENNITFVGPTAELLELFGDKTSARNLAQKANVPIIPGSGAVKTLEEATEFADEAGYPVIIKAAFGGGGRGMRVVRSRKEMKEVFPLAVSEAKAAFGNGTVFLEKYIEDPRHIEVQILGDGKGNVVHLYDRDCSVQRRHQKVVESAPARHLPKGTREAILNDAVRLTSEANYLNAGTVEFLVDKQGNHYFIEVNPRVQVEHTVTEEVTGLDIVQSQILIASGKSLEELGLVQDKIEVNGAAIQCRITTEDPKTNFQPDSGILTEYRSASGNGIRLDDGPGYTGAHIQPHYDSLLVKVTAHSKTFEGAAKKLERALREYRIRGVTTNIGFLLNVLTHPEFVNKSVTTSFIAQNPDLVNDIGKNQNRGEKMLRYLGNLAVNGHPKSLGATGDMPQRIKPRIPSVDPPKQEPWLRKIYKEQGPEAFAKAVRKHKGTLLTDTTWRDAHQSLLATRMRTVDMENIAGPTRSVLSNAFSLECWGGATFDVAMRFLHECPWDRLARLREAVPDIPFQMLLRGANAVGYTSYPDNAVYKFCDLAVRTGMDVFRVFDSLNYMDNMKLGMDAVGEAGGIIEAAICYTGDVSNPGNSKYTLDYYLDFARQLVEHGTHILAVKDMAGLLKPQAADLLISALRKEFPDTPIHVHTHDTAGTGVASMLAAVRAGADAVDGAIDSLSGTTSQPSLGAIVGGLEGSPLDTGVDIRSLTPLIDYWQEVREMYSPFESGQLSGSSDVYLHEIPGGQYTNLMFQSKQLNLAGQWPAIKKAYEAANRLLGDIVKVTPSSKVVGDLAQMMVQNKLTEQDVRDKASELSFPQSVIEYLQGYIGIPPGGFPEPFRSDVLGDRTLPNGKKSFDGRPGAELDPLDFDRIERELRERYGNINERDVLSYVMYPTVYEEWKEFTSQYGDVSVLPTLPFLRPMEVGEEESFDLEKGKTLYVGLKAISPLRSDGSRDVYFEMNGEPRQVRIHDNSVTTSDVKKPKAVKSNPKHIGAPMPGVCVGVKVKAGDSVAKGDPLVVLSAMKMETVVSAPRSGKIVTVHVDQGDNLEVNDLVVEIEPEEA